MKSAYSLERSWIVKNYRITANIRRGMRVKHTCYHDKQGKITNFKDGRVWVRFDGDKFSKPCHAGELTYIDKGRSYVP